VNVSTPDAAPASAGIARHDSGRNRATTMTSLFVAGVFSSTARAGSESEAESKTTASGEYLCGLALESQKASVLNERAYPDATASRVLLRDFPHGRGDLAADGIEAAIASLLRGENQIRQRQDAGEDAVISDDR